jgi:sugar (pentulose or hexulose) kinase
MYFMGIDVGTQGVRCAVADENGNLLAENRIPFQKLNESTVPGLYEQSPAVWAEAVMDTISGCTAALRQKGLDPHQIQALAVDGTSGTILPINAAGVPLCNGIMYNDPRASAETEELRPLATAHEQKLGLRFNSSFALPRILWLMKNRPEIYAAAHKIIHQADYIVGLLCGEFGVSDYSNALKTGYDLLDDRWPEFFAELAIDQEKLPVILPPGSGIAPLLPQVAQRLGMSPHTMVTAGATDGYASALSAGAVCPGNWASIIGTTLVLKGVSTHIVLDPSGSSYCHKLPTGAWMVGGASNVGGRCLNAKFDKKDFPQLDRQAVQLTPTGILTYPLTGTGERYPFVDPVASAFCIGDTSEPAVLYTALMEGVAMTERLAYERAMASGLPVGDMIFTTGGACKSDLWLQIRADTLNRCLKIPRVVDATMGMILIAASHFFGGLEQAAAQLIHFDKTVEPKTAHVPAYEDMYQRFYAACKARFRL